MPLPELLAKLDYSQIEMRLFSLPCKHCKKSGGEHKVPTLECPSGKRTRIGYLTFGPTIFEPEIERN